MMCNYCAFDGMNGSLKPNKESLDIKNKRFNLFAFKRCSPGDSADQTYIISSTSATKQTGQYK